MSRPTVLLALAAMLVMAAASPGLLRPYTPADVSQSEIGVSAAFATNLCYNCSDLASVPGGVSLASQASTTFGSGSSSTMSMPGWLLYEQDEAWIWRGKVRARWESLGFDSGIFELFMSMKGARTRLNLLLALTEPKDRMHLAQELGVDWKAVDYQVTRLAKCGLVNEDRAFGRVKLFRLTRLGEILLGLLRQEFELTSETGRGPERLNAPVIAD
jgi:hypothetical protein